MHDFVTEDALKQSIYHPHSKFIKATNDDSLLLILENMYAGLTFPSTVYMEIGL